jgi:hypothetical protein
METRATQQTQGKKLTPSILTPTGQQGLSSGEFHKRPNSKLSATAFLFNCPPTIPPTSTHVQSANRPCEWRRTHSLLFL